jgi:hypothetical protein
MTDTDYRASSLWQTAFGQRRGDRHHAYREKLAAAYNDLRSAAKPLLEQTARTLPQLTDHSGFHLDQLWEVASTVCGQGFEINPLEAFILGASFAFHDAALTAEAYDGGLSALKKTAPWQDAVYRAWQEQNVSEPSNEQLRNPPNAIANLALFTVLRLEHARTAETLPFRSWKHPSTKADLAFFSDPKIRDDYGHWIGLIAASHHWPINQLADRLDRNLPHSSGYPVEWRVDLLKIACILRCADAAAIDDRRAPARLFAIRQPTGTSRLHWAFQENLFPVIIEVETLTFKSKRPFTHSQMDEWWLAYDAISIAAEEIQASNDVLTARSRAAFRGKQIRGAHNPKILQTLLEVEGWEPVDTRIRIPNVTSLVERLGGTQLYGDDLFVPIRELVQNGCDAIRARRALAQRNVGRDRAFEATSTKKYPGQVILKFTFEDANTKQITFTVEDDGLGMPTDAMTTGLLDFGTSFWKTETAAKLYPGLQSDPYFRPSGKFGLGFYSIFMLDEKVLVTSRPWDSGEAERKVLAFSHGAKGRAELRKFDLLSDPSSEVNSCTSVQTFMEAKALEDGLRSISFRDGSFDTITSLNNSEAGDDLNQSKNLERLFPVLVRHLRRMFFALDVEVRLIWRGGAPIILNAPYYGDWTAKDFGSRLVEVFGDSKLALSKESITLLQDISDDRGQFYGKAGISLNQKGNESFLTAPHLGFYSIDGFIAEVRGDSSFVGIKEGSPTDVTRKNWKTKIPRLVENAWAEHECNLLRKQSLSLEERLAAAATLSQYDVNLLEFAVAHMNGKLAGLEDIAHEVIKNEIFALVIDRPMKPITGKKIERFFISSPQSAVFGKAFQLMLEPGMRETREIIYRKTPPILSAERLGHPSYYEVAPGLTAKFNTLFACLIEKLSRRGYRLNDANFKEDFEVGKLNIKRGRKVNTFAFRHPVAIFTIARKTSRQPVTP